MGEMREALWHVAKEGAGPGIDHLRKNTDTFLKGSVQFIEPAVRVVVPEEGMCFNHPERTGEETAFLFICPGIAVMERTAPKFTVDRMHRRFQTIVAIEAEADGERQ